MPDMPVRMATRVRRFRERGVMWDGTCGGSTLHSARWDVDELPLEDNKSTGGIDYTDRPAVGCDRCGTPVPWELDEPCTCGEEGCQGIKWHGPIKRFGGSR